MAADDITLLIAAPSPLMREALRRLPGTGRTVLRAATLAEALDLHAARRPHVVIIDAALPNPAQTYPAQTYPAHSPPLLAAPPPPPYDPVPPPSAPAAHTGGHGPVLDLVRAIRAVRGDEDVFLIVLTEPDDHALRADALAMGANDALRLPLEPLELDARVSVGARQARMARRLRAYSDRLTREMARVAELQMRLLPSSSPYLPGLHVESLYRPSGDASGDYFDYFLLPPRAPADAVPPASPEQPDPPSRHAPHDADGPVLRVVIADVSGHGARAAFLMSIVRTLVRAQNDGAAARHADGMPPQPLPETVRRINRHLVDIIGGEPDFVTLFAGDIDFAAGTLEYVNAGHCPALLRGGDGQITRLPSNAPLLGFFNADFAAELRAFPPGSQLLLFTDGLHDWTAPGGAHLGPERFLELTEPCLRAGNEVLAAMESALRAAAGGMPPFRDDVTALWIRRDGPIMGAPVKSNEQAKPGEQIRAGEQVRPDEPAKAD
ncbi:SpoIIE family protein phosphatase [Nitratidesulfovibrio liaohensis]|uniref:SpoIIE family protein phosphatase n=1 Tax=Nitratidesulfovibrio liaohensis TaxID=2604158 RepID=A0ABY9R4A5_9BACT|nr:SpoIIE family protein phosphatase [Nitratidesulfovibrio liaohensis]WMW65838.1 SpoIIE family protein phosphatase [Nitratidesulfovibrio liaohensis]